ncbi:hypothetical protein DERF_011118 [Dermatophagoides farinae]|uniref:Uncharacterized protein n=1 Tax=Dermatophagoides farinae TaxID=6954 RepID=A0A922KZ04_DERFA|nr:hypothetical protein DERF_011118 [Dermatophagoides farinae]
MFPFLFLFSAILVASKNPKYQFAYLTRIELNFVYTTTIDENDENEHPYLVIFRSFGHFLLLLLPLHSALIYWLIVMTSFFGRCVVVFH